jgi:NAD(P)-dependent dehydrogenase (short-subunit alcohol dehydrogenase family)
VFDFNGKVVAVTGASGIGIGIEIAKRFFASGAKLAICSRSEERIRLAAREIAGESDSDILAMAVDTSIPKETELFIDKILKHFGCIDILINNAGVEFPGPSVELSEEHWDKTVDTNLKGYFFASQHAAKAMISAGKGGCIVNIGSVNAVTVVPGLAAYAATKAGITQMTKSLAREWAREGIRVNCVAPGSVPTLINKEKYSDSKIEKAMCEKIPMGRRGTTGEIAGVVLFLAGNYSSYITGQTLFVDGGLTLVHG